ncbi:MAG TPA: nucleoside-diphosphate kinase, partial [Gaiellaceae bacterium]|nr:nucleoside-diphosphate kinase [Gaiellaceae bacterium]
MAVERSLILIKPDAVRRGLAAEILGRIESRGLTIRAGKLLTAD